MEIIENLIKQLEEEIKIIEGKKRVTDSLYYMQEGAISGLKRAISILMATYRLNENKPNQMDSIIRFALEDDSKKSNPLVADLDVSDGDLNLRLNAQIVGYINSGTGNFHMVDRIDVCDFENTNLCFDKYGCIKIFGYIRAVHEIVDTIDEIELFLESSSMSPIRELAQITTKFKRLKKLLQQEKQNDQI